ncbi:uncharacterized protein OCT59_005759 [Rhizophagus irregularis]|uniref:uncharacterized protein n=1 Tax=Rhizophagus irregularis TaxID=588596 RepID=UPI003317E859|nr:hypothetical protein OCT59_005759 [Rhizophagus irregularis]
MLFLEFLTMYFYLLNDKILVIESYKTIEAPATVAATTAAITIEATAAAAATTAATSFYIWTGFITEPEDDLMESIENRKVCSHVKKMSRDSLHSSLPQREHQRKY